MRPKIVQLRSRPLCRQHGAFRVPVPANRPTLKHGLQHPFLIDRQLFRAAKHALNRGAPTLVVPLQILGQLQHGRRINVKKIRRERLKRLEVFRDALVGEMIGGEQQPVARGIVRDDFALRMRVGHVPPNQSQPRLAEIADPPPVRLHERLLLRPTDALLQMKPNRHTGGAAGGDVQFLRVGNVRRRQVVEVVLNVLFCEQRTVRQLISRAQQARVKSGLRECALIKRAVTGGIDERAAQLANMIFGNLGCTPLRRFLGQLTKFTVCLAVADSPRQQAVRYPDGVACTLRQTVVKRKQRIQFVLEAHRLVSATPEVRSIAPSHPKCGTNPNQSVAWPSGPSHSGLFDAT